MSEESSGLREGIMDTQHASNLFLTIRQLYHQHLLPDLEIHLPASNKVFSVHKALVAAFSGHFRKLLKQGSLNQSRHTLTVEIEECVFGELLDYISTDSLKITPGTVEAITRGAELLDITTAVDVCRAFKDKLLVEPRHQKQESLCDPLNSKKNVAERKTCHLVTEGSNPERNTCHLVTEGSDAERNTCHLVTEGSDAEREMQSQDGSSIFDKEPELLESSDRVINEEHVKSEPDNNSNAQIQTITKRKLSRHHSSRRSKRLKKIDTDHTHSSKNVKTLASASSCVKATGPLRRSQRNLKASTDTSKSNARKSKSEGLSAEKREKGTAEVNVLDPCQNTEIQEKQKKESKTNIKKWRNRERWLHPNQLKSLKRCMICAKPFFHHSSLQYHQRLLHRRVSYTEKLSSSLHTCSSVSSFVSEKYTSDNVDMHLLSVISDTCPDVFQLNVLPEPVTPATLADIPTSVTTGNILVNSNISEQNTSDLKPTMDINSAAFHILRSADSEASERKVEFDFNLVEHELMKEEAPHMWTSDLTQLVACMHEYSMSRVYSNDADRRACELPPSEALCQPVPKNNPSKTCVHENSRPKELRKIPKQFDIKNIDSSIINMEKYHCKICFQKFPLYCLFQRHLLRKHRVKFLCKQCGQVSRCLLNFRRHTRFCHHRKVKSSRNRTSTSTKQTKPLEPYKCKLCKKAFENLSKFDSHMCMKDYCDVDWSIRHHRVTKLHKIVRKKLRCVACPMQFSSLYTAELHTRVRHNLGVRRRVWRCDEEGCHFLAMSCKVLLRHVEALHPDASYSCLTCDFSTKISSLLYTHHTKKHVGADHKCELCGKKYKGRLHYRIHMAQAHQCSDPKLKLKMCPQKDCDYSTYHKAVLKTHLKIHDQVKPFNCNICGLSIKTEKNLEKHRNKVHYGIRPFVCDQCGTSYGEESELKMHMARHSKDYKHRCHLCQYGTMDKAYLKSHLWAIHKIADSKKLFRCDQCDYVTDRKPRLREHMDKHSNNRQYRCHLCNKLFITRSTLKSHIKQVHALEKIKCDFCDHETATTRHMKEHVRVMHTHRKMKPFKCCYCDFRCAISGNCRKHIMARHKGKEVMWERVNTSEADDVQSKADSLAALIKLGDLSSLPPDKPALVLQQMPGLDAHAQLLPWVEKAAMTQQTQKPPEFVPSYNTNMSSLSDVEQSKFDSERMVESLPQVEVHVINQLPPGPSSAQTFLNSNTLTMPNAMVTAQPEIFQASVSDFFLQQPVVDQVSEC